MPVKWDATKDQHLLIQLISDPALSIGPKHYKQIADSWPESLGEAPTVRAISEHFIKIKQQLGIKPGSTPRGSKTCKPDKKKETPAKSETPNKNEIKAEPDDDMSPPPAFIRAKTPKTPTSKKRKYKDSEEEEEIAMTSDSGVELEQVPRFPRERLERLTKRRPGICQLSRDENKSSLDKDGTTCAGSNVDNEGAESVSAASSDDSDVSMFEEEV